MSFNTQNKHHDASQPQKNEQSKPQQHHIIKSESLLKQSQGHHQVQSQQLSMPSGAPLLIKSKTEHIKELMFKKGYLKIRITFPELKKAKDNGQHKIIGIDLKQNNSSKVILVPSSYTMFQLRAQIKLAYRINPNQAIFIFIKSEKITDSGAKIKSIYEKYVKKEGGQGIGCLQLNAYTTQGF